MAQTSSPAGQLSPDGKWIWNGAQWLPITEARRRMPWYGQWWFWCVVTGAPMLLLGVAAATGGSGVGGFLFFAIIWAVFFWGILGLVMLIRSASRNERRRQAQIVGAMDYEERTAPQIIRTYADRGTYEAEAARLMQRGLEVASVNQITEQGATSAHLSVVFRRRQDSMTLYTKQLAPEVRWMTCSACGHTVYEAPTCSYCGAPR